MNVLHFGKKELTKAIEDNSLVLVDFWAPWCGPCRAVAPVLEKIAAKYEGRALVAKMNIEEEHEAAAQYGIQSIPTVILFKDGKPLKKEVGVKSQSVYETIIEKEL